MNTELNLKVKWSRSAALEVARELCDRLEPFCERLIVAGSIRRRKAEVGDVEILYISRTEKRPLDMFATEAVSLADEEITRMLADDTLTKRLSKTGGTAWGDKNKFAVHRSGVPVDLFRTVEESWFNYLVCRTGPADSNARIATEAQRRGYRWNPYGSGYTTLADGTVTAMDSVEAVFAFVGLAYAEPWDRK
jgi:DNA polymerase/3'-5' exonuclease PolX